MPTELDFSDLSVDPLFIAFDQRAFGPGRLMVAFTTAEGRFLGLAHTDSDQPLELVLEACLDHLAGHRFRGDQPAAVVVYSDEPVSEGPPPPELIARFDQARSQVADFGLHLVDWFACDQERVRSARGTTGFDGGWWDVPASVPRRGSSWAARRSRRASKTRRLR